MQVNIRADEVVDDIIADEALRMAYLTSSFTDVDNSYRKLCTTVVISVRVGCAL